MSEMFDFIEDSSERLILTNAYNAITLTETWGFVSSDIESFMFLDDYRINEITSMMKKLGYNGHSGFSFGYTMRSMQYIARHGLDKFKSLYY